MVWTLAAILLKATMSHWVLCLFLQGLHSERIAQKFFAYRSVDVNCIEDCHRYPHSH